MHRCRGDDDLADRGKCASDRLDEIGAGGVLQSPKPGLVPGWPAAFDDHMVRGRRHAVVDQLGERQPQLRADRELDVVRHLSHQRLTGDGHREDQQPASTGAHRALLDLGVREHPDRDVVAVVDQRRVAAHEMAGRLRLALDHPRQITEVPADDVGPLDVSCCFGNGCAEAAAEQLAQGVEIGSGGEAAPIVGDDSEPDPQVWRYAIDIEIRGADPNTCDLGQNSSERLGQ